MNIELIDVDKKMLIDVSHALMNQARAMLITVSNAETGLIELSETDVCAIREEIKNLLRFNQGVIQLLKND